jgi:hypothetical protein
MSTVTTDVSGTRVYVAPYIGNMDATNNGEVNTLSNVTVTIGNVDQEFTFNTTEQQAIDILNAFEVLDISNGSVADISLNLKADTGARDALVAVLGYGITTATNGSSESVETWLGNALGAEVTGILQNNGLLDLLEASDLSGSFTLVLDASGGATALKDTFAADADGTLKALFLQIPGEDIALYDICENTTTLGFLPMTRSSQLTFVFDVSASNVINYYNSEIVLGGSGVTASGDGYAPLGPQTLSGSSTKRIAVKYALHPAGTGGTAFTLSGTVDNYSLTVV